MKLPMILKNSDIKNVKKNQNDIKRVFSQLQEESKNRRQIDPIGKAIQFAEPAACLITVIQGKHNWTGSGFLIDNGVIVTAEHVLPKKENGEATIQISFDGENSIEAIVIGGNQETDTGLLHCKTIPLIRPVQISINPVVNGDIIATIGCPEGWPNVVTVGRIAGTKMTPPEKHTQSWSDMLFIDAHILEGSSGSMVIDILGQVVGMVMGVIGKKIQETGIGQNAVVPSYRIIDTLEKFNY